MTIQKIEGIYFNIDDSMLAVWRNIGKIFIPCSLGASEPFCTMVDFDLGCYKNMLVSQLGINSVDDLPIGYYYAHHELKRGNFLDTDNFDEMITNLRKRKLV